MTEVVHYMEKCSALSARVKELEADNEQLRGILEEWRLDVKKRVRLESRIREMAERGLSRGWVHAASILQIIDYYEGEKP